MQFERTFLAPQGFCAFAGEVGKGGRKGNVREHGATPTRIAI
jgi:hypothetical protein